MVEKHGCLNPPKKVETLTIRTTSSQRGNLKWTVCSQIPRSNSSVSRMSPDTQDWKTALVCPKSQLLCGRIMGREELRQWVTDTEGDYAANYRGERKERQKLRSIHWKPPKGILASLCLLSVLLHIFKTFFLSSPFSFGLSNVLE